MHTSQDTINPMEMPRKDKPISLALDPSILKEVDDFIAAQEFQPTKKQVFEAALRAFLDSRKKDRRRDG